MEQAETFILDLILRSLSQRRALCGVVLAADRVELTRTLNLIADAGMQPGDLDRVHELAQRIEATAEVAGLKSVQGDAMALRRCAQNVGRRRGKKAVGAMLVAGLHVIDRILDAAAVPRSSDTPAPN